jgi:hypothetical protein
VNVPFGGPETKGADPPAGSGFSSAPCAAPTVIEFGEKTHWETLDAGMNGGVAVFSDFLWGFLNRSFQPRSLR